MTQLDGFLKSGSVYRGPNDQVYLWSDLQSISTDNLSQAPASFIASQDFFDSCLKFYHTGLEKGIQSTQSMRVSDFRQLLKAWVSDRLGHMSNDDFQNASVEGFERSFRDIQLRISRGEITKAVPMIRRVAFKIPSLVDRAIWLERLLEAPEQLSVYGIWDEKSGMMGATPEQLFRYQDGVLSSMALAGTCPKKDESVRLNLLQDPKEMKEHQFVKSEVQDYLSRYGVVQVSETEVVEYPTLLHLRTLMKVETSRFDFVEFVKKTHPTSALGVSPKNYGWAWLKDLPEQAARMKFGAPIVFQIDPSHQVGLVAIRNIQWNETKTFISAGCGIVAQSDLQQEWQEVQAKMNSVFKILGLI